MKKIDIYEYQGKKLNAFFPAFVEKILHDNSDGNSYGKKILIVFGDKKRMRDFDKLLWESNPGSWLPHLLATDENAKHARVVLTADINENVNDAEILCTLDSPINDIADIRNFSRIICFFEKGTETENTSSLLKKISLNPEFDFHSYTQQPTGKWE